MPLFKENETHKFSKVINILASKQPLTIIIKVCYQYPFKQKYNYDHTKHYYTLTKVLSHYLMEGHNSLRVKINFRLILLTRIKYHKTTLRCINRLILIKRLGAS